MATIQFFVKQNIGINDNIETNFYRNKVKENFNFCFTTFIPFHDIFFTFLWSIKKTRRIRTVLI